MILSKEGTQTIKCTRFCTFSIRCVPVGNTNATCKHIDILRSTRPSTRPSYRSGHHPDRTCSAAGRLSAT
jgi:hypothetical protein